VPRHSRRILRVDMVRYRPGDRAVLRHRFSGLRFYVRVVRPAVVPRLLGAIEFAERSAFAGPRLAGCWAEGGVLWLPEIPGENMRQQMRAGSPPEPDPLLDGLESLWDLSQQADGCRPFDLAGAYRRAERTFRHVLRDDEAGGRALEAATRALRPFVESWHPTTIAHNDFYDDQMIVQPDGRVALVDLEEVGPGDPCSTSATCSPTSAGPIASAPGARTTQAAPTTESSARPPSTASDGMNANSPSARPSASSGSPPTPSAAPNPTGRPTQSPA